MDDCFIINQVISGNINAFKVLVIRYQRPIFKYLHTFQLSDAVLEEIAQETFLKAFRSLHSFDSNRSTFSSWLFTISKNLALSEISKKHRKLEKFNINVAEIPLLEEKTILNIENAQSKNMVRVCLSKLPKPFREVLILAYMEELSLEDISNISRIPIGTVKSRIFRGKAMLLSILKKAGVV